MKLKTYILIFVLLLSLTFIGAGKGSVEGVIQGKCIELIQTCNCTSNNISSIVSPNQTVIATNLEMQSLNGQFNYTFCNTSSLGIYTVNGYGNDPSGKIWIYDFEVTPTGNQLNTSQSLLYIFLGIVSILAFILTFFVGISLPFKNKRNGEEIISINWKKYLKIFCFGLSYMFLIAIIWIAWNLIYAYAQWQTLGIFFKYLYTLLMALALPMLIGILLIIIINYVNDRKIEGFIKKTGLPYNG